MKLLMPSEEKRFLDHYPEEVNRIELPQQTAYDFLLERNKRYMDYTALSFDNREITYEELHTNIERYSRALYSYGIHGQSVVGVCLVNTPESIYILYALNRIGATIVGLSPLNNEYKMARDIEIAQPDTIITADIFYKTFAASCEAANCNLILFSPVQSVQNPLMRVAYRCKQRISGNYLPGKRHSLHSIVGQKNSTSFTKRAFDPKKITDIMFTGGSSGTHKGVDLNDNGANCVVQALDYVLELEPGMIHLGNIPFGHMVFGRVLLHYALCTNLHFALTLKMLPDMFLDELLRVKPHGAMGGPVHWETLIDNPKLKPDCLCNLIQPLSGGEVFKPERRRQADNALRMAGCNVEINDGFGMTEMWAPVNVFMSRKNTSGTLGHPIPFINAKVVDPETLNEVGRNVPGLLFVTGPGQMFGYHNNKDETDKVITYDEAGVRWYNTGDLVMRLDTDEFQYVGRQKRNFVCGVDNIYPEQIEQMVLALPEIREAAVTKVPDNEKQYLPKYHISLKTPDCDKQKLEKKIYDLISKTLGESATPGYITYYDKPLPRTDNGKINFTLLETQQ